MRRRSVATIVGALACLAVAPAGAATGHQASRTLVKDGTVTVLDGGCGAHALEARVTISRLEFEPAQAVTVHATVRNVGSTPCSVAGTPTGPAHIGPCGSLSMEIQNGRGTNVWPGTEPYNCPLLSLHHLAAGGHFAATGSWDQQSAADQQQVPPGRYRVVVGSTVSFSITIR